MATYSAKNNGYTATLTLTPGSQSVADNTTVVSYKLTLTAGSNYFELWPIGWEIWLAGSRASYQSISGAPQKSISAGGTITLASGSVTIPHNVDGEMTVVISFRVDGGSDASYLPGTIRFPVGTDTLTLPTIPRASSITSASDVNLGSKCTVKWTPASSSFRYKLRFEFGSWGETTGFIEPKKNTEYSYEYTLPLSLASQVPKSTFGTGKVYLYTYNGSSQIGSTASKQFTAYVPSSVIPTVDTVEASIINSNPVINGWGIAVAGYTKIKLTATASGAYGSTISGFTASGWYSFIKDGDSLSYEGSTILSSGDSVFKVVARDSRGRTSSEEVADEISFYAYSNPRITRFSIGRSSADIEKITVNAAWSFTSLGGNNSASGTLQYRKSTENAWTTYGTVSNGTAVTLSGTFSKLNSYVFRIQVKDSVGNAVQQDSTVSTMQVLVAYRAGGKGIAFGKFSEENNFDVAMAAKFESTVNVAGELTSDGDAVVGGALTVNGVLIANNGGYFRGCSLVEGGFNSSGGSNGYVQVMTIKVTAQYSDSPIIFEFTRRGYAPVRGFIRFKNSSGTDPDIETAVHEVDVNVPFYLVKSATSTWKVYIQKSKSYDNIAITRLSYNRESGGISVDATKANNNIFVSSLPSDAIASTAYNPYFSGLTTSGKATLGSASIGGNNVAAVVVETNNGAAKNDTSWGYRKYSDGTCDLWAFKYIDMSCTTALGSWYRSNEISMQALPFTMVSTTFTYSFEMDTSKNSGCLLWNIAPVNGTIGPKFYAIRPTSGQAVGCIDVHIWGRWK